MSNPPHVVGVVGSDIVNDSRVKKVAASAARAGFRSTIVCYTASGTESRTRMGDVDVIRIPVPFTAKNHPGRVPRQLRPIAATELADRHLGPRTIQLARKRRLEALRVVDGSNDHALALRLRMLQARMWTRRFLFRVRRRGHVTFDRAVRKWNLMRRRLSLRILRPLRNPVANVFDYEVAFGPVLEDLKPDVIHAHDYHMIGVAVTAARRLRASGISTKVVYDAHELVEGLSYPESIISGWLGEEGTFIGDVDAVTGVSPEQVARLAERYGLQATPTVILNAPLDRGESRKPTRTVRDGIGTNIRILVYHGNLGEERGVFTMVEALSHMESDVHVVFVAPATSPLQPDLEERAGRLGVLDRVHFVDFVPAVELTGFLRPADIEVIPYLITGNHDIALPNKLFEAIQADLPVLTSDMRSLSRFIEEHGIGVVFDNGSAIDLAAKATTMLGDLDSFRQRLTPALKQESSWDAQALKLARVYHGLIGTEAPSDIHVEAHDVTEPPRDWFWGSYRPHRLAIGPRNMAGQAYLMCRAVERHLGIPAESFSVDKSQFEFDVDHRITAEAWRDPAWQVHQLHLIASRFTHVLAESGSGILGSLNGGFIDEQLQMLKQDNVRVAVMLHGSEIRDPNRHRTTPFSPYAEGDELIARLEQSVARLRAHLDGVDVPIFVTTPDLLLDIDGIWLPVVIDVERWDSLDEAFQSDTPRILHLPTNGLLKGSRFIDPVLRKLEGEGLIEYMRPQDGMTAAETRQAIEAADFVIDGIVLGAYGVMSCQAMAAGRIAIANLRDLGSLRARTPIIDADPSTLEPTLREILSDRDSWKEYGEAGRNFVAEYHDGSFTAHQLAPFLGVPTDSST